MLRGVYERHLQVSQGHVICVSATNMECLQDEALAAERKVCLLSSGPELLVGEHQLVGVGCAEGTSHV